MSSSTAAGSQSTPSIVLPKGGGAVQGIGETFQHDAFTGTATWRVPIPVSPGRAGFGPELALSYGSGAGNGLFGLGWEISIPRIARKTELGLPRYDATDTFVMSGAEDLVPLLDASGTPQALDRGPFRIERLRPRVEGLFARIERWTRAADGDVHWRATTRGNVTSVYGRTPSARIVDPEQPNRVFAWLLEETFHPRGDHILYEYAGDAPGSGPNAVFEDGRSYGQRYPRRIFYVSLPTTAVDARGAPVGIARTGVDVADPLRTVERRYAIEVVFDYGGATGDPAPDAAAAELFAADGPTVRPDPFSTGRPGFDLRTLRRCEAVRIYHRFAELGGPTLVRSVQFSYRTDGDTGLSLLEQVTVAGHRREGRRTIVATMPPLTFRYGAFRPREQSFRDLSAGSTGLPALSLQDRSLALIDLFGDGAPDLVQSTPSGWRYWRNLGDGAFDAPRTLEGVPAGVRLDDAGISLADVDGDGQAELVVNGPGLAGFFTAGAKGPLSRFVRFASAPPFRSDDPNLRMVDLTGDGRADALLLGDAALYWFENRGADGFAAAVRLPRPQGADPRAGFSFADPGNRVHLADMNGDGLADLVLVHQGRVDYWPNLGYGRFGRRVTMAAIPDPPGLTASFDPQRVLLADVNGTGCADLVYVDVDRTHIWFNRSGNAWSAPTTLQGTPQATSPATARAADIFGTGTASLLWSSDFGLFPGPHYKAIDLCGGVKPYLLEEMDNGLGTVKRATYAPSTRFALADARAGVPSPTRLPFPVHVVAKVEVIDRIGRTRLVTSHAYHHGHYDAREREFRGFARVEQIAGETFESFAAAPLEPGAGPAANADAANYVPPTLTVVWHHTGAWNEEGAKLADVLAGEFYGGDAAAPVLAGHDVDEADAPAEAYRALRGARLRSEIYSLDGTSRAPHPFLVESSAWSVQALQPRGPRSHGVFLRSLRESLAFNYEREPADPRLAHTLNLEVDAFGNVLSSASIFYPRRVPAQPEQGRMLGTLTASSFINTPAALPANAPHHYVGVPVQSRQYEIAHAELLPRAGGLVTAASLRTLVADPDDFAPLEARPAATAKVLREWSRTYYRADAAAASLPAPPSAAGRLPFGAIDTLGLPFETCQAVLSPGLRAELYDGELSDADLQMAGYFLSASVDSALPAAAAGYLWRRSPRQATDAARFHVPARVQDPFGNVTRLDHDAYALAVVRIADPLGNETRAEIDYRTLQPGRVIDPNGTEARVAFDAFGLVAGTARTGKNGEGDTLGGFASDLPSTDIAAFFADPMATAASLLGAATTRIVYDLDRPRRGEGPAAAATISRESHTSDEHGVASPVQVSIAFSDGHDRVVQIKSRAAPGTVNGVAAVERWVGSGWTIFNNKGAEVQKFEPFFSASADFEFASARGVTRTNFYDPAGRPAAVLHPDGSYAKVLFGAWEQVAWDANDTVKLDPRTDPDTRSLVQRFFAGNPGFRTWLRRRLPNPASPPSAAQRNARQDAAVKAMAHAGTPARQFLDPVGHSILSIATDGTRQLETRTAVDVAGNPLSVTDPRGVVCFSHRLDMLGRKLRSDSSDAGRRTAFLAADDRPVLGIDAVGQRTRTIYDALRRPSETRAAAARGSAEAVVGRVVYGDTLSPAIAAAGNLRTRVAQTFDGACMTEHERYDFKGNLVEISRRFLPAYGRAADWSRDAIPTGAPSFRRSVRFDALERPVEEVSPDGSITTRRFDEGGRLAAIDVDHRGAGAQAIITAIDYNARGQRERIVYGNGSVAARTYEPDTFRIASITLKRGTRTLQALAYAYDPVGNVTSCADNAFDTVFNANQRIDPVSSYTFDAFYRLAAASGREHEAVGACPAQPDAASFVALQPQPVNNARALRNYTETYAYDDAGNLLEIVHAAGSLGSFTRRQIVAAASNRLASSDAGCAGEPGFAPPHDANGNIRSLAHLPALAWDHANRLVQATLRAAPSGGAGDQAFYAYDAAGLRARKVVERGGAPSHSNFYIGAFERFENHAPGADPAVRETLHVMDGDDRLAMIEAWTEAGRDERRVRLQFANHLGSAQLELDGQGLVIGYEEYRPYGDTAYTAGTAQVEVERRRYRYSGKERDAETGLYYFGARYYASWMGRWLSCDPAGEAGGLNQYGRSRNNPVSFVDRDGYADQPVKPKPQVTQTPLNSLNVSGSGVQAEGYKKRFWLREGQATTPFGEDVEAWRMCTLFEPSAGLPGDYPTAVSKDLVLLGTGQPGKSMSTPAPLAGNHLAAKARGEQLKALFDRSGHKPNRFAMTVIEPETVTRLGKVNPGDAAARAQSFVQSVIGRSTNESVAAIGLEIDPASVRIETGKGASGLPLSMEGFYYRITGQFRAVAPPAIPPGDLKLGKVAMHGGGVLLTLALGGLSDTPAHLTKDGKVDYHLDDWMYGVHGWDATGNELGATFGMCPVPASMSSDAAHENDPAFMVGVGAAVGGIAGEGWGAIPGAIVGYLLYLGVKDEN